MLPSKQEAMVSGGVWPCTASSGSRQPKRFQCCPHLPVSASSTLRQALTLLIFPVSAIVGLPATTAPLCCLPHWHHGHTAGCRVALPLSLLQLESGLLLPQLVHKVGMGSPTLRPCDLPTLLLHFSCPRSHSSLHLPSEPHPHSYCL